jgi:trk system potassium uptake protein TrkA
MKNQTGTSIAVHRIADGKSEAAEFHVTKDTANCGVPLRNIKLKKGMLIAAILHLSQCVIPNGDSCFYPGDTIIVVSNSETGVARLNDIFE